MHELRKQTIHYIDDIIKDRKKSLTIEDSIYRHIQEHYKNIYTTFEIEDLEHSDTYKLQCKKLIQNVKLLKDKILNDNLGFKLQDIGFQTYTSLCPENWKNHIQKTQMNLQKVDTKQEATTDQFYCGKCHKNKTTYYELQTRGMDEPATAFITCIECGHKWRQ